MEVMSWSAVLEEMGPATLDYEFFRELGIASFDPEHDPFPDFTVADKPPLHLPCSESPTSSCHILGDLLYLNKLMYNAEMRLEEVAHGNLELVHVANLRSYKLGEKYFVFRDAWAAVVCLLKKHHCIKSLRLEFSPDPRCKDFLCHALLRRKSLKKLVFGMYYREFEGESILLATRFLVDMKELELHEQGEDSGMAQRLGDALQAISTLTTLKMWDLCVPPADMDCVLQGLRSNPNIAVLYIQDNFLRPQGVLADYVISSKSLKVLALKHVASTDESDLEDLLKALPSCHQLEELSLVGFVMKEHTVELLAEVAARCRDLIRLNVTCERSEETISGASLAKLVGSNTSLNELAFRDAMLDRLAAVGEALRTNTTLRKLSLRLLYLQACELELLLAALASNKNLEVTFEDVPEELVSTLYQLWQDMGMEDRLKFNACFTDPLVFVPALMKCTKLPSISYLPWSTAHSLSPRAFSVLAYYHQLTELSISQAVPIAHKTAVSMSSFMSTSKSLRSMDLSFPATVSSTLVLLAGISRNASISKLRIQKWSFGVREVNLLFHVAGSSKTLNDLHVTASTDLREPPNVPVSFGNNHCLIAVSIDLDFRRQKTRFRRALEEVTWRNQSLLHLAVQFVMGSRGKRFAEAFEKVPWSLALVKKVQESFGESENEAMQRLKESRRFLVQHFLVAVGVVREAVVCFESSRVQLDQIGLDNWLHIRKYLKASDIKESSVEADHGL